MGQEVRTVSGKNWGEDDDSPGTITGAAEVVSSGGIRDLVGRRANRFADGRGQGETKRRLGQLKGFGRADGDSELPFTKIRRFIRETSTGEDKEQSCK